MKAAVQELPAMDDIELVNWTLRQAQEECGPPVCPGTLQHQPEPQRLPELSARLGFVLKRPKKRLVKTDKRKRESFVTEYATLTEEAQRFGAKIFFADEAHFRADAGLRDKWVLRGEPALVDSSSPQYGEKASYYSAVCLETGEVEWMELEGNSNSRTSVAFLMQLRERYSGLLKGIWDNAPAHRGEALWECLAAPGLGIQLVNPRFHEGRLWLATVRTSTPMRRSGAGPDRRPLGNLCLGTKALVQQRVNHFLAGLMAFSFSEIGFRVWTREWRGWG